LETDNQVLTAVSEPDIYVAPLVEYKEDDDYELDYPYPLENNQISPNLQQMQSSSSKLKEKLSEVDLSPPERGWEIVSNEKRKNEKKKEKKKKLIKWILF